MSNIYADEGTAAHQVLEWCLESIYTLELPAKASDYIGTKVTVTDEPHARLSPSGAKRWMTCPAAPGMEAQFPDPQQGSREIEFTADYAFAVQVCLDWVDRTYKSLQEKYGPVTVRSERKVSPKKYLGTEDCDGTSDIALITNDHVVHADFKAGAGVPVAVDDPQNDFYLLGTCAEYDTKEGQFPFTTADLVIIQPRCDKVTPRIRERHIDSVQEWKAEFIGYARKALDDVNAPDPVFTPSQDGCMFCSAKGACAAYSRYAMGLAGIDLEGLPGAAVDFAATDTRMLSGKELRGLLDAREIITGALQAAEAYALDLLREGRAPIEITDGYKLVRGRAKRTWGQDEEETFKALKRIKIVDPTSGKIRGLGKKDLYVTHLLSIKQTEGLFSRFDVPKKDARWEALKRLITKPEGKLTIAPKSDPRQEVQSHRSDIMEAMSDREIEEPPPQL